MTLTLHTVEPIQPHCDDPVWRRVAAFKRWVASPHGQKQSNLKELQAATTEQLTTEVRR